MSHNNAGVISWIPTNSDSIADPEDICGQPVPYTDPEAEHVRAMS